MRLQASLLIMLVAQVAVVAPLGQAVPAAQTAQAAPVAQVAQAAPVAQVAQAQAGKASNAKKRKATDALTGHRCKPPRTSPGSELIRVTLWQRGADSLGLRVGQDGVTISKPPTGIAQQAGLALGDVIVTVNDVSVNVRPAKDVLRERVPSRPDTIIEVRRPVERVALRRLDGMAAPVGEGGRPQKRAAEAKEDKEGSAAGESPPTLKGQGPSLHKKPRGRKPRGTNGLPMRWDGSNKAGHWVDDNGGAEAVGSQDDPIDLCD